MFSSCSAASPRTRCVGPSRCSRNRETPSCSHVDRTWSLVSPYDAWLLLGGHVRDDDLERLEAAVRTVLLELDPALDMEPEERWRAQIDGKVRAHSHDLRHGMAETLALLGVHGNNVDAVWRFRRNQFRSLFGSNIA